MSEHLDSLQESDRPSRITSFICISWKVFTCILSHVTLVTLVVAYCIGGALLFEHLEAENERQVKRGIIGMRTNVTDDLWHMTSERDFLREDNWTDLVKKRLEDFEHEIIAAMKTKGWDGNEDVNKIQWTFFGALFYSIIVITTIGYGHIAPKTNMGKVTTIFYAILGIPLMLLCLSNIGDIMASSFRFLYWRVCCFVCTREPKRTSARRRGTTVRRLPRMTRSQPPPIVRRSIRTSQRSADSGIGPSYIEHNLFHAYSDPELRQYQRDSFRDREFDIERTDRNFSNNKSNPNRNQQRFSNRVRNRERLRDRHTVERERNINRPNHFDSIDDFEVLPPNKRSNSTRSMRAGSMGRERIYSQTMPGINSNRGRRSKVRSKSVDPRTMRYDQFEDEISCKTPVLCNRYAIDDLARHELNDRGSRHKRGPNPRSQSMPRHHQRYGDYLDLPETPMMPTRRQRYQDDYDYYYEDDIEMVPVRKERNRAQLKRERERAAAPRIMSPLGYYRQTRPTYRDDDYFDDEWDSNGDIAPGSKPVPIWLCVFLVVSYILGGAFLFSRWENWSFLDSAYFCFVTLTTIGFGDFVPAQGVKENAEVSIEVSIALCSLYLLFGISLLAMSFNLVQEEVIANVKDVARRLGILKEEEIDD